MLSQNSAFSIGIIRMYIFSGEITAEELQQRLEGAKERLALQANRDNREGEGRAVGGKNSSYTY